MISEVPLGAFLSGGVDSSAVVAMMAGLSAEPVNTCSIAFADPAFDESRYAQQVAERYRTRHFVDRVESDDFDLIDTLARSTTSRTPTARRSRPTASASSRAGTSRSRCPGDGGDESFGGYRRYRLHLDGGADARARCRWRLRGRCSALLGRAYPKADWAPRVFCARRRPSRRSARDSVEAYFHSVSILRDDMRRRLFSARVQAQPRRLQRGRGVPAPCRAARTDDPLALIQYLDLKTYLVGDINTKVDRASMAHSLEVREPLMDHPLVEWLATLPSSLKMRGGEGK